MSDVKDFIITKNNILKEYVGKETNIVVPDVVQSIGEYVFSNSRTAVYLPDSVTSIRSHAFSYWSCMNEEIFALPSHLKTIGSFAFKGCSLSAITIPGSVRKMDWCAFAQSAINSAVIENGVKDIGKEVFADCRNLMTLSLPATLKSIDATAFKGCLNIREFTLPRGIKTFEGSALELIWNYFNKGDYKPYLVTAFITQLPELVCGDTALGKKIKANKAIVIDYALANDNIQVMETLFKLYKKIPSNEIEQYIDKATDAVMIRSFLMDYKNGNHANVSMSPKDAFTLSPVRQERTLADWKKIYVFDTDGETAIIKGYKGTETSVIVPESFGKYRVVAIAKGAFSPWASGVREDAKIARQNIQSVVLPDSLNSIGAEAFKHCDQLTSVSLSKNITIIENNAFSWCTQLKEITLPPALIQIGPEAFGSCSSLAKITIPAAVTMIGLGAFRFCNSLKTISVDEGNTVYHSANNCVIETASETLICGLNCSTIPTGVTSIAEEAFSGCKSLTRMVIPNSITTIGNTAFSGCENLTEVILPNEITTIGSYTFAGCKSLTHVEIPNGVTAINDWAFNSCDSLTSVMLPDTLQSIGSKAFYFCKKLTNILLPESVTKIADWAFSGCENLAKITIPKRVKSVSKNAFIHCKGLQTVVIQNGIKKICEAAFEDCKELKDVFIPDSVTEIYCSNYGTAFKGCPNLTIHAPAGSYAEQYAKENDVPFIAE